MSSLSFKQVKHEADKFGVIIEAIRRRMDGVTYRYEITHNDLGITDYAQDLDEAYDRVCGLRDQKKRQDEEAGVQPPEDTRSLREKIQAQVFEPEESKYPWGERGSETRRLYREERRRLEEVFKQEALKDVGLAGHPKAQRTWDMAWNEGHANGYGEVLTYLEMLADLLLKD